MIDRLYPLIALLLLGSVLTMAIAALRRDGLACWSALAAYLAIAATGRLVWQTDAWMPLWLPFAYPAIWLGLTGLFWLGCRQRLSRRGIDTAGSSPALMALLLAMPGLAVALIGVPCLAALAPLLPAPASRWLAQVELTIVSGYLFAPQFAALTGALLALYGRRWAGHALLPWWRILLPAVLISQCAGVLGAMVMV